MNETLHFGGSFNPPHLAHVACSAAAAVAAGLSRVVLIPSGRPALKSADEIAPAAHRLAMTRLAAASADAAVPFAVDDLEMGRTGTTYTIDTVRTLKDRGTAVVHWLIGADQLLNLHRWHEFETLLRLAKFWVMARPGYAIDWAALHPAVRGLSDRVLLVPQMDVSATDVRRRLHAGESVDGLLAPAVRHYIRAHGLYVANPAQATDGKKQNPPRQG